MSDDSRASSKFQWIRLAGLGKLASLQCHLDEDLDKLDSASALHVQQQQNRIANVNNCNGESASRIFRGDSGDSNLSSVGDIPIELPHLEEEDDMYNISVFKTEKSTKPRRGRSRSLDDAEMLLSKNKHVKPLSSSKRTRMLLRETGRAVTYEDDSISQLEKTLGPEIDFGINKEHQQEGAEELLQALPRQKKLLKDFKSTLSASLKSIDISIRSLREG